MKQLVLLVCLTCVALKQVESQVDPRGARPVEQGTRADKCAAQKEWPFCTDDDWGPKCPSGCRIQGLMDKNDHELLKKIQKIRSLLDKNKANYRSTDQVSKQTYDFLREKLTSDSGNDNSYFDLAQSLRKRITDMKIRIDRQMKVLGALKDRVKDQVTEMQRLEVDIDIKLRSCKGSCSGYTEYQLDKESYVALDKQVTQLESNSAQSVESVGTLYVMKSRPLKDAVVDSRFKSKGVAAQQREDLFPQVNTVQFVLEQEGSSTSPATISKDPACSRFNQQKQDGRQSSSSHMYKKRCSSTSPVPLCSDDDWVSKCPSGCRLQGLISQMETDVERKLQTVCKLIQMNEDATEKSMSALTNIYTPHRRVLVSRYTSEVKFLEGAEMLARNLTLLRKRSTILEQKIKELSSNVKNQVEELYRTEVEVDVLLRTCKGTCRSALPFSVDHHAYQTLQVDLNSKKKKAAAHPTDLPQIKVQTVHVGPPWSTEYRKIPTVQRELLTQFEDISQNQLVLESPDVSPDVNTDPEVTEAAERASF